MVSHILSLCERWLFKQNEANIKLKYIGLKGILLILLAESNYRGQFSISLSDQVVFYRGSAKIDISQMAKFRRTIANTKHTSESGRLCCKANCTLNTALLANINQ